MTCDAIQSGAHPSAWYANAFKCMQMEYHRMHEFMWQNVRNHNQHSVTFVKYIYYLIVRRVRERVSLQERAAKSSHE